MKIKASPWGGGIAASMINWDRSVWTTLYMEGGGGGAEAGGI